MEKNEVMCPLRKYILVIIDADIRCSILNKHLLPVALVYILLYTGFKDSLTFIGCTKKEKAPNSKTVQYLL